MSDTHPDSDPTPAERALAASDGTLAGYIDVHNRPPAYDGPDGHPYTVSLEVEKTANLRAPYEGYLVFPRWAQTGVGIVGHVATDTLVEARTEEEARASLGALDLYRVQALLEEAIRRTVAESQDGHQPVGDARDA